MRILKTINTFFSSLVREMSGKNKYVSNMVGINMFQKVYNLRKKSTIKWYIRLLMKTF